MIMHFVAIVVTTGCIITVVACLRTCTTDLEAQPVRVFARLVAYHRSHHFGLTAVLYVVKNFF